MKYLLALLSGFILTSIVFVSGAAVAIMHLAAEPVPVSRLYAGSSEPIADESASAAHANQVTRVLVSHSHPQRSGTTTQALSPSKVHDDKRNSEQAVDPTETASTTPDVSLEASSELREIHMAWCSERYRSYDPEDNSYNSYSGERRECHSPYSKISDGQKSPELATGTISASAQGPSETYDEAFTSEAQNAYVDPEHIRSCFARYRSYRPEDNTYQPYGGGPRRQCE